MKTLSFVKQALAVALLISASQASAMSNYAGKFGSGVKSVLTAHETGVAWLVRKGLGCTPQRTVNNNVTAAQTVLEKLTEMGWAGRYKAARQAVIRVEAVINDQNQVVSPAVPAVEARAAGWQGGKPVVRNIIAHVNTHSNKYLWTTRVALLAAIGYGAYALYNKYYAETVEDNKEDAEPTTEEVVVVEETTAQPVQPVRSAQSRVFNPAA